MEDWKIGRLEDWKIGRLEDWKISGWAGFHGVEAFKDWKMGGLERSKLSKLSEFSYLSEKRQRSTGNVTRQCEQQSEKKGNAMFVWENRRNSTYRASTSRAVWSETRHAMPYSHPHAMHTPQHIQSTSRAVRSETGKSYNMLGTGQQLQQWTCADQWLHRHVGWCLCMCLWDSRGGLALCLWLCRGGLLWPSAT